MSDLKVNYEWTIEELDEFGDIIDSDFSDRLPVEWIPQSRLKHPSADGVRISNIALIRYTGNDRLGKVDINYAYVNSDGFIEDEFDSGHKVPDRYKAELQRVLAKIS